MGGFSNTTTYNEGAVDFIPDAPEHILQGSDTHMSAMVTDFVPGTSSQLFQADRMKQHASEILHRARLWNPDPTVAGLIPGSQQSAPKSHQEERSEYKYRLRLKFAADWNDSYTNPLNHEPAARKANFKIHNEDTDESEWKCLEVRDEVDHWVHHINFFGQLVYTKSATSPAATIAVLKSSTKWFGVVNTSRLRISVLVAFASRLLDPIVYYGKPEVLDQLRGTALEEACIGQCDKFYSNNGWWQEDEYTEEEYIPRIDTLDPGHYQEDQVVINGCTPGFPSRVDIITAGTREQVAMDKACRAAVQARISRGPVKSKLASCCISYDSADDYPDAVVDVRTYSIRSPPGLSDSCGNTPDTGLLTTPPTASPSADATLASPAFPPPAMSSEEFNRRLEEACPSAVLGDDDDYMEDRQIQASVTSPMSSEELNRRLEEAWPSDEWDEDDYMDYGHDQASVTLTEPATTPRSRDITDREELNRRLEEAWPSADWDEDDYMDYSQDQASVTPPTPTTAPQALQITECEQPQVQNATPTWEDDEDEVPLANAVAQQTRAATAVMATETIVRGLVQGTARQPVVITGAGMRPNHPAKTVYFLANLAFTGLLANLRFGCGVALGFAISDPLLAMVPTMLPTIPTVASICTSMHKGRPQQRITEVFDDEEEIGGTVVHSDVMVRNTADDTFTTRDIANDTTQANNEQSGATPAQMPPSDNSRPRTPPRQSRHRRVALAVPRTTPMAVATTASPSPSLASLCRFIAEASPSPTESSYDQWPEFSGVHYYWPSSSVSGQVCARDCDDEVLQGKRKGWFKKGLDTVKEFFSKKT
ncbi:hypothetical protein LTR20_005661 [Exophiala xenobiotica]|nr:hypothetical protein LTR40_008538 [Exophiala xenobiotica]KAK5386161.1 hypothetical protein LTS13_001796 [Exophiala xenobiotica]KAK5400155.1 hypothetical protein LTR79_002254 [Exophiala xenobiotica]KAK5414075.1 hypothetical protein LTR90_006713 [Exophiala xenobiotica]KAK5463580.1 hypothetical protein LTR20_005661 [Exophiala xenobiotica]